VPFRVPAVEGGYASRPLEISRDGRWAAYGWVVGAPVELQSFDGVEPKVIGKHASSVFATRFNEDASLLVTTAIDDTAKIWKVPDGTLLRTLRVSKFTFPFVFGTDRLVTAEIVPGAGVRWKQWSLNGVEERILGTTPETLESAHEPARPEVDPSGTWVLLPSGHDLLVYDLNHLARGPVRRLGSHPAPIHGARFSPDGRRCASFDDAGEIRLWSFASTDGVPVRVFHGNEKPRSLEFQRDGSLLVATGYGTRLWDLEDPGAAPRVVDDAQFEHHAAFHPDGRWLLTSGIGMRAEVWPLTVDRPITLDGTPGAQVNGVQFAPDGSWIAVSSHAEGYVRLFPLDGTHVGEPETLFRDPTYRLMNLLRDDGGRVLVAGVNRIWGASEVLYISVPDRKTQLWTTGGWNSGVDAEGRRVAAWVTEGELDHARVWDSRTGETVDLGTDMKNLVGFARDGRVLARNFGGLWIWDVATRQGVRILEIDQFVSAQLCPDRETILIHRMDGTVSFHGLDGKELRRLPFAVEREGLAATACDAERRLLIIGRVSGDVEFVNLDTGESRSFPVHASMVRAVAIDPKGRWIATSARDGTKLWPIPNGPSLYALSSEDFNRKMRSFTNLRAVKDDRQPSGFRIEASGLPDWKNPPTW
jgi:WD40 repeat protein